MRVCFITFRSITFAQRGEELLRRAGIATTLQRTPKWMEEQGCGYCLRLRQQDIASAVPLLRENQTLFRKIYYKKENGNFEEARI